METGLGKIRICGIIYGHAHSLITPNETIARVNYCTEQFNLYQEWDKKMEIGICNETTLNFLRKAILHPLLAPAVAKVFFTTTI